MSHPLEELMLKLQGADKLGEKNAADNMAFAKKTDAVVADIMKAAKSILEGGAVKKAGVTCTMLGHDTFPIATGSNDNPKAPSSRHSVAVIVIGLAQDDDASKALSCYRARKTFENARKCQV